MLASELIKNIINNRQIINSASSRENSSSNKQLLIQSNKWNYNRTYQSDSRV